MNRLLLQHVFRLLRILLGFLLLLRWIQRHRFGCETFPTHFLPILVGGQKPVHVDAYAVSHALAWFRIEPVRDPAFSCKVRRFSTVDAGVESPMIGTREGDDELTRALYDSHDLDATFDEHRGFEQRHLVS